VTKLNAVGIASVVVAVNNAYKAQIGEAVEFPTLDSMPEPRRNGIIAGVEKQLASGALTPEESHNRWRESLEAQGYRLPKDGELAEGQVEDKAQKLHSYLRPFSELSPEAQVKSAFLPTLVNLLAPLVAPRSGA
jgi:hypothetical protein